MKYYLSKSVLETIVEGSEPLKSSVAESLAKLIKDQHLFYTGTVSILPLLEKQKDQLQKEIIWNQIKRLCLEVFEFRTQNLSLSLKFSGEFGGSDWVWNEIAVAVERDLDGFITVDRTIPDQRMIRVLFAQEINFDGIA
ncbi:hypothetical protein EHQ12_08015 [Leptospira gomenensis]|uniref:PIN domain-containing protein n=1 Tax=Leptospira gomenensis TaxID=2484974 RepID=A0A5F1YD48_9LEPT|nr:hypothetical protein [Leptospira gomenensis]TGK35993.1 hypothetical protein EHQ17_05280 [Leptospira gomenensis]TGK39976.1 hypothetical protein EHQ12_08015 [Leptospira gomenensis]TGK51425.1 hypothetical protein EHQ07_02405 [Leptospira gomenensis]TGK64900.1 hypothetical protein EHQ13_06550 [Leptospira gomenensis]